MENPIGIVKDLEMHLDDRGFLFEALRADDDVFTKFGQAYVSATLPGVVKGFHKHEKQLDHVVCIQGQIKMVLVYDGGPIPLIEEHHLSILKPQLVVIPTNVYHGWMCVGDTTALVMNVSSEPYDSSKPDEVRLDPHTNPWGYVWETKDK